LLSHQHFHQISFPFVVGWPFCISIFLFACTNANVWLLVPVLSYRLQLHLTAMSEAFVFHLCHVPSNVLCIYLTFFLSRCESMLKFIAGRSLFTRFLFVWFCFNTTWKCTPLFEFTW
jgi:hypothetical protein